MNREVKLNYFDNTETGKNSRYCWNKYRSYLSKKFVQEDSKLILIKYLLYVPGPLKQIKFRDLFKNLKHTLALRKISNTFQ